MGSGQYGWCRWGSVKLSLLMLLGVVFGVSTDTLQAGCNLPDGTSIEVGLDGYAAWRENDGDMVLDDEESDPGVLVTAETSSVGDSYDPREAKLRAKALDSAPTGVTRWLRVSDATKVEVFPSGSSTAITFQNGEYQISGGLNVDKYYEVHMCGTWDPGTSVTLDYFLKDNGQEISGCSDTVSLLGPVVMAIGNSMTYGLRRNGDETTYLTGKWDYNWDDDKYPTATVWADASKNPKAPNNIAARRLEADYQGWRGYLESDLPGFAWDGHGTDGHGPKHMGYCGAQTEQVNAGLNDPSVGGRSSLYPKKAFTTDSCYAIVIYFIGLNDIIDGNDKETIYGNWQAGLTKIMEHRADHGRTLVIGVKLPLMSEASSHYSEAKNDEIEGLNALIEDYSMTDDYTEYVWADTQDIVHDANDDGLHYHSTGYGELKKKIFAAIKAGLE